MAVYGHLLRLRLFLEGVEVPVVSAQIQSQKNSPAVASIQIPANDYALDLRPRTLVHLFMYDIYNGVPPADVVSIGAPGTFVSAREDGVDPELAGLFPPERFESTPDQDETDLLNENYKLIFGGEVVGFGFSKSPMSRSITLQCLDWSSYWDIAYQYQVSGFSLGGAGIRGAFTGASTTVFNDFLEGSADIVSRIMNTPPRSYPNMSGTLMAGLMHVIEAIGGVYYGRRAIRGVNDFFSLAEIRLHLTQMVGASPYTNRDEQRLMRANGFGSLFRRNLAGLGRLVSIRQILLALQRYIFHEIIPITSPRYIPPLYDPNIPRYETHTIDQDEETAPLARIADRVKSRALDLKERLARCNTADDALRESNLRGGLRAELLNQNRVCVRASRLARAVGRGRAGSPLTDFWGIPTVAANFETASERWGGRTGGIGSMLRVPGDRRVLPVNTSPTSSDVSRILDEIIGLMEDVLRASVRRRIQRTTQQPDPPPRLLTQIYRPNAWMVAPPRCNVIFPELYSNFSYSRNYMQETSRLLLRTHSAFFGSDILFDGFYMAPSRLSGARSGTRPPVTARDPELTNADYPLHIRRDLMDHELYTGIIPAFERMSDLNLHALRGGYYDVENVRLGYAQLACNFIFFQQRFQSRQLQLAGKFNPYCVLGFPMLVIDRYLPTDSLRESTYSSAVAARLAEAIADGEGIIRSGVPQAELDARLAAESARIYEVLSDVLEARPNTHYLGTPELISHSLDTQSGGTTQIQMSYARTTSERTEFLGDNVGTTGRRNRNVRVVTEVGALRPPQVGGVGFRGGTIVEVRDITSEFLRRVARARTARRTETSGPSSTPGTGAAGTTGATGTTVLAGSTALPPASRRASDRTVPLYIDDVAFRGRARRGTRVRVGIEQPAANYGPEVVAYVGAGGLYNSSTVNRAPWDASASAGSGGSVTTETLVTFRAYRIVENLGAYRRESVNLPPEVLTFPPWYGDQWRSEQVGGLYAYFFSVGAITDPLRVVAGSADSSRADPGAATPADGVDRTLRVTMNEEFSTLISSLARGEFNDPAASGPQPGTSEPAVAEGEILGPAGTPPTTEDRVVRSAILGSQERSVISEATEELVRIYSLVKLNQFDVHQFIKAYTWRPIASMVDLFGTANLQIADDGSVTQGVEGFHSRAFGDFDDLRRIIGPGDGTRPQTILGLTIRDPDETTGAEATRARRDQAISARLDTRKEKRVAVLRYLYTMFATCGVLG
jgi:hypothetical protein